MPNLQPGHEAPVFVLPSSEGTKVDLKSYRGKKNVVLYFYPKDSTPGCTKEACGFRDAREKITKTDTVILGVSLDSEKSHQRFIQKHELSFPLLSDTEKKVSEAYGVYKLKKMYGREFWGIERSTFLIDKKGKIIMSFLRVKVDGHVDAVLAALERKK
jgi:peroxiredoxin Q/BCP